MLVSRSIQLAVIVLLALTVLPNSFALADETITVQLASGRTFTGSPHARTDRDRLWLQFGGLGASVMRPIKWPTIESMTRAGQAVTKQQVLGLIAPLNTVGESTVPASDVPASAADQSVSITIRNAPPEIDEATQATAALDSQATATHIDSYATLENWDGDPQPDGLLLHIQLLDADRRLVVATGSLQAELFAPIQRRFQAVPHGRGTSVLPLARWSEAIEPDVYRQGEIVVQLPFTAAKPVGNALASPYGLLHIRLAVPGHGVFENSTDAVRIRPFTPTRDLLERQDRRRRLFTEPAYRAGNVR